MPSYLMHPPKAVFFKISAAALQRREEMSLQQGGEVIWIIDSKGT